MNQVLIKYLDDDNFIKSITAEIRKFDTNFKTILFVEPYGSVLSLIQRAIEKKYNIIVLTANSDLRIVPNHILNNTGLCIQTDTANDQEIINLSLLLRSKLEIHTVIPGFEYFVPISAKISELLKLPGIDPQYVWNLRRKDLMRSLLNAANMQIPNYVLIKSLEELDEAIQTIGFPAVCKPIDAAGSVNVRRVTNRAELLDAATRILSNNDILWGYKLSNALLLEEYIPGKEYSIEGIVQAGQIIHCSITEKFVSDQIDFIEVGHVVNPPIDLQIKICIQQYIERVIRLLRADNCPFHAEIRLNKNNEPILMEIAARLAGDKIGELINLSKNINYFDYVLASYLGESIALPDTEDSSAGIRFFYRPQISQYSTVTGTDIIEKLPIENISMYYTPNTLIPDFPKPLRRLGHAIAKHDNYQELIKMLEEIDNRIIFHN